MNEPNTPSTDGPQALEPSDEATLEMMRQHPETVVEALGFFQGTPRGVSLFDKMEPEHVTQYLEGVQEDERLAHEREMARQRERKYYFTAIIIALGALIFFLLPNDKDLLEDILKIVVSFAGGVGTGIGIKSKRNREKQS